MERGTVERFLHLFQGNPDAFGVYTVATDSKVETGKKVKGSGVTRRGAVTPDLWEKHLAGSQGLGIVPIRADGTIFWGMVDVDVYGKDLSKVVDSLTGTGLIPCRSKSGGLHVFAFFKTNVKAGSARKKLIEIAAALGYPKAEVFPKQTEKLDGDDLGNWLNMPYFGGDKTNRYAYGPDGASLTTGEFLDYAEANKFSLAEFVKLNFRRVAPEAAPVDEWAEAPPCLQELNRLGFPEGTRNNGMLAVSVLFRKMYPEDWQERIKAFNAGMAKPLPKSEINDLVKSAGRKEYNYRCKETPIVDYCNRPLCLTRRFGVSNVAYASVTRLTKIDTMPPSYYVEVDGVTVGPLSVTEIYDQRTFQRICFSHNKIVAQVKNHDYIRMLSDLMTDMITVEAPPDSGPVGAFWSLLREFVFARFSLKSLNDVVVGRVYRDKDDFYFTTAALRDYLKRVQFSELTMTQITALLRQNGYENQKIEVNNHTFYVWKVTYSEREVKKKRAKKANF